MQRLPRPVAFGALAATLSAFLFASSAPSPLYVVYQEQWGFSDVTLTAVFAVYALALLGSLLVLGSISDHIGRRPTLVAALAVEIVAMVAFAEAGSVVVLAAARMIQGVATGIAMGAISAALIDLESTPGRGALAGVAAPLGGLATGALATGLLVDYGPAPTQLVYLLLLGFMVLAVGIALGAPETVAADGRWRETLRPRIGVPAYVRSAFSQALPCLTATWALGGLFLSLAPSLTSAVFADDSHLGGGLPIFLLAGLSSTVSILVRDVSARIVARAGLSALIAGISIALVALVTESGGLFLVAAATAGLGFGPAFGGIFRLITSLAPPDRRAELVSSILAVSYLAFSIPAVAAGVAIGQIGLRDTALVYGGVLIAIAALALGLTGRMQEAPAAEVLVES